MPGRIFRSEVQPVGTKHPWPIQPRKRSKHRYKNRTSIMANAARTYHAVLVRLMAFTNNQPYAKDHVFSQDELAPLVPDDIVRWMCQEAYGTPDPGLDANPTNTRSSSLIFWKKAILFYMPNRLMPWNTISSEGNPTRSIEVNELIKKV